MVGAYSPRHPGAEPLLGDSFVCGVCGETHAGQITDWAYTLPDVVWAIPQDLRAEQAKFDSDLCHFDDRWFFRCILPVPLLEGERTFNWGVWVETDRSVFEKYISVYTMDGSDEPRGIGVIANAIPVYAGSLGMEVEVQFGPSDKRPSLYLPASSESALAREQRHGLDNARYLEILTQIVHRHH